MTGGTIGVPRTLKQIAAHPVTCYLFGAGKGDPRTFFNTWTNVSNTEINISGNARIYGSTFGGGEDGHVIYDAETNIGTTTMTINGVTNEVTENGVLIGTTGTSYVDGNVFGAGRGYSGDALTAGSIGGNVTVNIKGGTMLGSIYGGGRLASVGIGFNSPNDASYGSFTEDGPIYYTQAEISAAQEGDPAYGKTTSEIKIPSRTYGHVTVNISGGTIGNDLEDISVEHTKGGNVYGGSMGRLKSLDDVDYLQLWPQLGQVKSSTVNISGNSTIIKGNVYGGGELGTVRDNATIVVGKTSKEGTTITKPTIFRDIFGGGYGSEINNITGTVNALDPSGGKHTYLYTPMKWSGCVGKGTEVNIYNGWVKKNVYGGGEMASVGIINYEVTRINDEPTNEYKYITQHNDADNGFILSWPYEFNYVEGYPGTTKINIFGGRLGITNDTTEVIKSDNGDVYGGGKGLVGEYKDYVFCANVGSTEINIKYPDGNNARPTNYMDKDAKVDCIAGAVYGGAENGHVMGDTKVKLENGLIGHALYGGGSGKGKFETRLLKIGADANSTNKEDSVIRSIYSITAGKVFGNTTVEMSGGYVVRNVFGGGTLGSVGKGNYAGGTDDYSYIYANNKQYNGYGEALSGPLWTSSYNPNDNNSVKDNAWHFLNSGKCTVKITGGTVGYVDTSDPSNSIKDNLPYGNVFGGCRGEAAPNITESPRYLYCPEFFVGYANETEVIIGDSTRINDDSYTGPTILGSVYGGGQDGHVRRDAHVIINKGEIGLAFNEENRKNVLKTWNTGDPSEELDGTQWLYRGNVYGAGSGISKYKYDFNYNGKTSNGGVPETSSYHGNSIEEEDYSTSAGSVTRFTTVDIKGGTIHRNVYGGGSLASVGPPAIPPTRTDLADKKDVPTGTHGAGWQSQCTVNIAGKIGTPTEYQIHYGGEVYGASRGLSPEITLGSVVWTQVNIFNGANIQGNVFGGGDAGMVKKDAEVIIGK
jgi:hypothetical protein